MVGGQYGIAHQKLDKVRKKPDEEGKLKDQSIAYCFCYTLDLLYDRRTLYRQELSLRN